MTDQTTTTVTGEWTDEVYEAADLGPTWNGWETPRFTKSEAERVVADQGNIDDADQTLEWHTEDGVAYVLSRFAPGSDDEVVEFIAPDADGLYNLGLGWCWMRSEIQ